MANTLFLRLEGPLQSWGERSRWSVRDSAPEPTKSGVIGLLGCALGLGEDEPLRALAEALTMGVRVDRPGIRLVDYHTIGGGYDEPMLLTAEGKPKRSSGSPHTEISLRAYLCDASFLVAMQGPDALIAQLAEAVQAPVWPFFLGRKSCPPSRPVFEGVQQVEGADGPARLQAALAAWPWPDGHKPPTGGHVRGVIECAPGAGATHRRDQTLSRRYRRFAPRYTRDVQVPLSGVPQPEGRP